MLGEPQRAYRTIHITGTNGKGSTSQMVTKLLMAHGLTVGTYTSPHLERVNERMMRNGLPIDDDEFAENVLAIAELEPLVGRRISYFEILTAVAFRWFADSAIDVGVIEVGLLGRWDATNVVESDVAVLTNISLDHTEFAGPTHAHIAREKVGIVKSNSVFVQGETRPDVQEILAAAPCAKRVVRDEHFEVLENELAVGGRLVSVRTTRAEHRELFVPLHGRHQGDNAATAIVAASIFAVSITRVTAPAIPNPSQKLVRLAMPQQKLQQPRSALSQNPRWLKPNLAHLVNLAIQRLAAALNHRAPKYVEQSEVMMFGILPENHSARVAKSHQALVAPATVTKMIVQLAHRASTTMKHQL
ncbi:MAG: hypothetical protein EBW96_08455, partial [Actinobacteria bacterium]|nr:hypothetical protein [Actinomycetota bacterium]